MWRDSRLVECVRVLRPGDIAAVHVLLSFFRYLSYDWPFWNMIIGRPIAHQRDIIITISYLEMRDRERDECVGGQQEEAFFIFV